MVDLMRKKSPRAPSITLDEALERTGKAYEKQKLHPAPTDVVAQNIGYKGANNGAALAALASLRYYGLLERPREGLLAVAKDYENYKFAPNDAVRRALVQKFLRNPPLFRELLDQYESGLPSNAALKYELLQRKFLPAAAATLVAVLQGSVEFAGTEADRNSDAEASRQTGSSEDGNSDSLVQIPQSLQSQPIEPSEGTSRSAAAALPGTGGEMTHDRIPVRLTGNRRAWLVIPEPLYEADKKRLKAQIDLLLTEDDDPAATRT